MNTTDREIPELADAMSGADSMGIVPPVNVPATDEAIDAIADIEMLRRTTEKDAGFAMSRSSALHRLRERLDHEMEGLRLRGPGSGHLGNVQAVKAEIARVTALSAATTQGPAARNAYPGQREVSWRNASRNPAGNKGRRTMGRTGGR
jgi:hypothetical protein